ncbi:MAG: TrmH family RNA methyltransferase [Bacteroidia bacterium]
MRKLRNEELGRKTANEFKVAVKTPLILVLDNVRSLNNVGSAFRTADSFLLEGIYLCGVTGTPPDKDIHKTALGAEQTVEWKHFNTTMEALSELKKNAYVICSVEQAKEATYLDHFPVKKGEKYALIFGNEVYGVEQEVVGNSDHVIEIPQLGSKHSLNISVSIGIVVWDFFKKLAL